MTSCALPQFFGDFLSFFKAHVQEVLFLTDVSLPSWAALRWPCWPFGVLTLNKCQLCGSILTESGSLLKLINNLLSTGDRESLTVVPVAQGDALATGFTLTAEQGVSTLHRANWVVVCLVPTGDTISSPLGNGPAVCLWVEVSQLCLVMTWP